MASAMHSAMDFSTDETTLDEAGNQRKTPAQTKITNLYVVSVGLWPKCLRQAS